MKRANGEETDPAEDPDREDTDGMAEVFGAWNSDPGRLCELVHRRSRVRQRTHHPGRSAAASRQLRQPSKDLHAELLVAVAIHASVPPADNADLSVELR